MVKKAAAKKSKAQLAKAEMTEAIAWFKKQFGADIDAAVKNTPFNLDMLVAIALQETYYIWRRVFRDRPLAEVLALCVGDTLDAPRRSVSAFPANREELEGVSNGKRMFAIARAALEAMAQVAPEYKKTLRNED